MRRKPSATVASAGVTHTKLAVEDELKWLFREQPTEDYGIDAQIEVVDGEDVRGRLLALQIKSGESWFQQAAPGGWWFRPDAEHVTYWLNHSLPVAVVLYHPGTKRCHWQLMNRRTLQETSTGGWKLLVPEAQVLDASAAAPLREAAEGDPYVLRIRQLQLAKPWMEMLASGKRLVVDIEEWINKTSGRGDISLGVDKEDGEKPEELASWGVFLGLASYAEAVPRMFAWADVQVHEETYEDAEYDQYEAECVIYDNEGDRFVTEDFDQWRSRRLAPGLRPYASPSGEVDFWRLELTLNELGKAFLVVDRFGTDGRRLLT
ncbi:DUF4365 domain-containing protein [Micromonospora chalcea]|uniref:DUF4365 domain-containing protein n=1 Tax=Micromonospora chalcea TaxID=1874 RepID=UPI002378C20D|nr:DUF4365 domain-containing protein [Micromonospora chalcea]WDQ02256.1 DUF4365 domain-containing protein [Micromonospora chalcea]